MYRLHHCKDTEGFISMATTPGLQTRSIHFIKGTFISGRCHRDFDVEDLVCVYSRLRRRMHRSYQPLKPVTNRYLQQKWDQENYDNHRKKVTSALPVVDTKGSRTPSHVQLKLKKLQLQDERLSVIDRDNRLLASRLATIVCSRGLVDHCNHYHIKSLNADRRRQELQSVGRQNVDIFRRLSFRQSEYRRQVWLQDWERTVQLRDDISRYPPLSREKQRSQRKVKFAVVNQGGQSDSSISTDQEA